MMMAVSSVLCHHHIREMNRLKVVLVARQSACGGPLFGSPLCGRLGAEPASTKPNTI